MRAVRKERGAGGRADAGRAAPVFESASRARLRARRVRVVSCSGCVGSIWPGCVGSRRRVAVLAVWSSPSMVRALASVVAVISVRTGRMRTRRAPRKSPASSSVDVRRELLATIYLPTETRPVRRHSTARCAPPP